MDTDELMNACTNVLVENAENIINNENNKTLQYERTHDVVLPPDEKSIALKVSSLKHIKLECEKAKKSMFNFSELWFGIATLLLGAFFSALISEFPYELKFLSVLFYSICPIGGIGFGVAYYFCRFNNNKSVISLVETIEEYIPNIEETEDM